MKIFHVKIHKANTAVELSFYEESISVSVMVHYPTSKENDDGISLEVPFSFNNPDLTYKKSTAVIKIADLQSSPQAESGACWNVYMDENSLYPIIINSNAMSQPFRGDVHQVYSAYLQKPPTIVICVPRIDSKLDDCLIGVNTSTDADVGFKCSTTFTDLGDSYDLDYVRKMVRPLLSIVGNLSITQGTSEIFNVTVNNQDGSIDEQFNDPIYFEATGGHLAVSKVQVVNGVAKVRLIGDHLIEGDAISIKAGTKFYTSLAKIHVRVTA